MDRQQTEFANRMLVLRLSGFHGHDSSVAVGARMTPGHSSELPLTWWEGRVFEKNDLPDFNRRLSRSPFASLLKRI